MKTKKLMSAILAVVFALGVIQPQAAKAETSDSSVELHAVNSYGRDTGKIIVSFESEDLVHFQICPREGTKWLIIKTYKPCVDLPSIKKSALNSKLDSLKGTAEIKQEIKAGIAFLLLGGTAILGAHFGLPLLGLGAGLAVFGPLCVKFDSELNNTGTCAASVQTALEDLAIMPEGKRKTLRVYADLEAFYLFMKKVERVP